MPWVVLGFSVLLSGAIAVFLLPALDVSARGRQALAVDIAAPAGTTPDDQARSVARIVGGLIGYARWPRPDDGITICTMGTTRFAQRLSEAGTITRQQVTTRAIAPGSAAAPQRCDVLYLGATTPALQQRAIMAIHGQPVLSIAEDDPDCRSGAMFCLLTGNHPITFRLNIDAVSRSTIRVDPRVLRLFSDNGGGAPS